MGLLEDSPERYFKKEFASLNKARRTLPICKIVTIFQRKIGTNRKQLQKQYYLHFKNLKKNLKPKYSLDDIYPWFINDGVLVCAVYLRGSIFIYEEPVFNSSGTINNFTSNVN